MQNLQVKTKTKKRIGVRGKKETSPSVTQKTGVPTGVGATGNGRRKFLLRREAV